MNESLVTEWLAKREQIADAQRELAAFERELIVQFERSGVNRVRSMNGPLVELADGRLVVIPTDEN